MAWHGHSGGVFGTSWPSLGDGGLWANFLNEEKAAVHKHSKGQDHIADEIWD